MKKPCIRGLKEFEKKGCPQKPWSKDTPDGCPAWKELIVSSREDPLKKENKAQCILEWQFEFQWAMMGLLEGNQKATESFRNGMVQTDGDGQTYPKPDSGSLTLLSFLENIQAKQRLR